MTAEYTSKHGNVARPSFDLYMAFADMRNFVSMLPDDKKKDVTADFDFIKFVIQGFSIGVKVSERKPYDKLVFEDDGAPFRFNVTMHFDPAQDESHTDFWVEVGADLNFMMKMMLGSKIQEGLDKLVDGMVDPSKFAADFKF